MPPPITPKGPQNVSGEWNLIQALNGPKDQQIKETRGYENGPPGIANDNDDVGVDVALSGRSGGDMHNTQRSASTLLHAGMQSITRTLIWGGLLMQQGLQIF